MSIDVVARLQLRADQFSSETGSKFAELKQRAATTAQEVRSSFTSSFAEVQRLAGQALEAPRLKSGGLDLSGEIAQLRARTAALDSEIEVNRALSVSYLEVKATSAGVAEQMRLRSDAAMIAARTAEADRTAIQGEITALEELQRALNRNLDTSQLTAVAGRKVTVSAEQQRQSMIMLGQQFQDFTVQAVSGQNIATAFAQQIGQAGFAIQGMGGKLAGVAAFLGSGWGIAAQIGLVALTPLVAKMFEGTEALKDKVDKLKKDAEQSEITRKAEEAFTKTLEGQLIAAKKLNDEMDRSIRTDQQLEKLALGKAVKQVYDLRGQRPDLAKQLAAAQLEAKLASEAVASSQGRDPRGLAAAFARAGEAETKVKTLAAQLKDLDAKIAGSERAAREARLPTLERQVADSLDASKAATDRYTEALGKLREERAKGLITERQFYDQDQKNQQARDRAIKAAQDAKKSAPALGTQLSNEQGAATLKAAQGFIGARENTATGKATLRDLFSTAGMTIDPEKVAWCAAFVNAVLAGQGIKGTGSLSARSFLNFGTATNRPSEGDIVVLRRGTGDQGHVGFYAGTDAKGRVRVTGGNQGDEVSTTSFARSDVLGFRRAPTASKAYADELRDQKTAATEAKRTNEQLETSLDQLAKKFNPTASAARAYREELGDIFKLVDSGKLTQGEGFDYAMRARQAAAASRSADFNNSFREVFGAEAIDSAIGDLNAGIASSTDLWNDRLRLGAINAGEALAGAVGGVADLFGVRISGPLNGLLQPGGIAGQSQETAQLLGQTLKSTGINLSTQSIDKLSGALAGAAMGQIGGSVFSSLTGAKQSKTGSAVGGVAGELVGKELGGTITKAIGGKLGSMLGSAAGPIGAALGGALGGVVGGLFGKKANYGTAVVSSGTTISTGNNKAATSQAGSLGDSVTQGLDRIASQLGGQIGSYLVSIGTYDGDYRVSTSGQKGELSYGKKNKDKATLVDFGQDQEAAIRFAILDALNDGAVKGISEAAQRVLRAGKDLDAALNKAVLIESVPKDLKAILDPVGAAVDELNRKFKLTVDALKEGGASADQMAQAQQLYDLQLQQVKASTASASASLKSFLTDLKLGGNSPYSLRDQEATAAAQLKPFLDQIGSGQRVDQEKYQAAARTYLDIERQLYGSTAKFFDAQALIQAATAKAIDAIDNALPITPGVESPFAKATADSAAKTASNTQTGNELLSQLSDQMAGVQQLLAAIAGASGSTGGFIGTGRAFRQAA